MRVRISDSDSRTAVPYAPAERPESRNWGYIDLKRNPERIDDIPELKDVPELYRLVKSVNAPGGFFRTIGCEKALSIHDGTYMVKGYVGVLFEILDLNRNPDNWAMVFDRFSEYVRAQPQLSDATEIEFEIDHVVFNDHKSSSNPKLCMAGRSAAMWAIGFGATPDEAWKHWNAGVVLLRRFLESMSQGNRFHLNGQLTVS